MKVQTWVSKSGTWRASSPKALAVEVGYVGCGDTEQEAIADLIVWLKGDPRSPVTNYDRVVVERVQSFLEAGK